MKEIQSQKKLGNPTVQEASRKVAKWEDAGQEAPVKLCVMKFFIKLVQTCSPRIDGSNYTPFFQLKIFYGCQNDLQS